MGFLYNMKLVCFCLLLEASFTFTLPSIHRLIWRRCLVTSSTTTNECEVHLYHLFVALLPRYQTAQQRPKWPIGPIAWPRLFWAGPKWPIGPMLWPTCVEFVPCNITVQYYITRIAVQPVCCWRWRQRHHVSSSSCHIHVMQLFY